jgi:hypothetical protein
MGLCDLLRGYFYFILLLLFVLYKEGVITGAGRGSSFLSFLLCLLPLGRGTKIQRRILKTEGKNETMTVYGLDTHGSIPGREKRFLSPPQCPHWLTLWVSQRHIHCVPLSLSPEVKRPGREADHSHPSSAEVKSSGVISPLPYTSSWRGD